MENLHRERFYIDNLNLKTGTELRTIIENCRVNGRVSLRGNEMWHELRNSIIMRNAVYAKYFGEINLTYKLRPFRRQFKSAAGL